MITNVATDTRAELVARLVEDRRVVLRAARRAADVLTAGLAGGTLARERYLPAVWEIDAAIEAATK